MDSMAFAVPVTLGLLFFLFRSRSRQGPPLPPGPPKDPFIGSIRHISAEDPGLGYHEMAKKYGDVMHFESFGKDIIVLDSLQAATELLEKRGGIYSDRPPVPFFELAGFGDVTSMLPYGKQWRRHRRHFHTHFSPQSCEGFKPLLRDNAHILMKRMLANKGDYNNLINIFTASVTMRIAYGRQIISEDDRYIQIADTTGYIQNHCGPPGTTLVDIFPILRHFPSWFPGTASANFAREHRGAVDELFDVPFADVRRQMASGSAHSCFVSKELQASANKDLSNEGERELKAVAAMIFGAGAETTWSTIATFILAILHYPEVQKIGQAEIDKVIGHDRLPTFEDFDSLPFIECVVKEALRWHPVAPLGLGHRVTEDDVYRGMLIPKGAIVFSNIMGMALDENIYSEPTKFKPTRFLPKSCGGDGEPDFDPAFGFGRRVCPGRHLARSSVWIVVASIFATLNIVKAKDGDGGEITPKLEFVTGLTSQPKPFPCSISPRSEAASDLVTASYNKIVAALKAEQ